MNDVRVEAVEDLSEVPPVAGVEEPAHQGLRLLGLDSECFQLGNAHLGPHLCRNAPWYPLPCSAVRAGGGFSPLAESPPGGTAPAAAPWRQGQDSSNAKMRSSCASCPRWGIRAIICSSSQHAGALRSVPIRPIHLA